jgi:alginate O-acetyltransferase complex protein AlgJ
LSYPIKLLKTLLAGIFLTALFLPVSNMVFDFIPKFDLKENRNLAHLPPLSLDKTVIKKFPKSFESYFNDHFGFRELAIHYYQWLKFKYLRISPHSSVILGNENWLFYTGDQIIEDYRGLKVYSPKELEAWKTSLEKKRDWLEQQGVTYLVVIAPEKSTIYPEFVPKRFNRVGRSAKSQLVDYLKRFSDIDILDLQEPLLEGKKKFRVYLRTDTHWNIMGAFIVYQALLKKLNQLSPQYNINPFNLSKFKISYRNNFKGDLSSIVGTQGSIYETHEEYIDFAANFPRCSKYDMSTPNPHLVRNGITPLTLECPERDLKLVMFRDSFATSLIPFISEHFQRSIYILNSIKNLNFLKKTVVAENPDIVIEEVAERRIGTLLIP